jgi:hypothetical protein
MDTIDNNLARHPPHQIRLQLLMQRNRLVAELDDVRSRINDILARRDAITAPDPGMMHEIGELADRAEAEANQTQKAESALNLAKNVLQTALKGQGIG